MREMLASGGEVGADLLAVDWTSSSVGPPETWSLSLGNAVRILLTSKFSMWMAWGPDLTFFCNDAYRRDTLGTKYPWALGRPAHEVWSEIWDEVSPRIEHVIDSGEATWDEALQLFLERSGYVEETYHTFSYSPLADDDGSIAGMLCVVAEVTEQVISERRMNTLRELGIGVGSAASEAEALSAACELLSRNPASLPFVVAYLFSEDGARAELAGRAGIDADLPATPRLLQPGTDAGWPVDDLWRGQSVVVDDLAARFGDLPTGSWAEPPLRALVTPILQASEPHPYGFLVVGLNRYRPLDASYHDFVDLIAGHLSSAIGDARAIAFQVERAETLARLDQAKSDFLANVSHELRTPLTLLLGPAEDALADDATPLDPEQRRRVEVVVRNGQRMLHLVNTLLDFSRLEAGEDDARFVPTDLARYTRELTSMFESAAARAGLRLDVACDEPLEAYVDRDHWSKIVLNLLSNALKFTFEGGIRIGLEVVDGEARLAVSDTGTGIPADELPLLFDRFHRVTGARSRTHEGSGIGLALVAELAAAHGGRVDVASEAGQGTTFTVSVPLGSGHLPAAQVADAGPGDDNGVLDQVLARHAGRVATHTSAWARDETSVPAEPDDAPGDEPGDDGREPLGRVLVVDDNADMRRYISDLLRGAGYRVLTAVDGLEALALMRRDVPDLVLTDVMMPRLDGFGLLREMQDDPALTVVPVIMLSARAGEDGTLEGLNAGADDYLVKPFSARELLARVRVNLELDRSERVRGTLERSKDLLDQAQRLARIGSWEIDLDRDRIVASDAFLDLIEYTRDDLVTLGTTAVISSLVHPDDLERVFGELSGAQPGDVVDYETRIVLPSGGERLYAVRGEVPPHATDGTRLLRGSFQDITEQRVTQELLIAAEAEREVAAREWAIADELQRSLMPDQQVEAEPLDIATFYRAGTEGTRVGGDWYDVIDLGAGRFALVIGDVMGRGVRAAAVTGQLRAAVRAFARVDLTPADLLEQLEGIVQDIDDSQIVTCVYAVFDAADLTLSYASAGHLPVLVSRGSDDLRLATTGPPLGAGFYGVDTVTLQLAEGDVLTFYTDGLVERRGNDLFADIDVLAALSSTLRDAPVADQIDRLVAAMETDVVEDDIALLIARVVGTGQDAVLRLRLAHEETAPAEARRAVAASLHAWGVPDWLRDDVVLAVSELVTNAVIHARPPIALRLSVNGPEVVLEIQDRTLLRPRRRRPDDADEHGRGLNILEAVSSSWGIRSVPGGKAVWASFRW